MSTQLTGKKTQREKNDKYDNNDIIINVLHRKYSPIFTTISSYYFYNFAYIPKFSNDTFILN